MFPHDASLYCLYEQITRYTTCTHHDYPASPAINRDPFVCLMFWLDGDPRHLLALLHTLPYTIVLKPGAMKGSNKCHTQKDRSTQNTLWILMKRQTSPDIPKNKQTKKTKQLYLVT